MFKENSLENIRYATIKGNDVANGPGVRVSLYVQGCPHHCKGCFNEETWDFDGGELLTTSVMSKIMAIATTPHISGLSILGGEPFAQNLDLLLDFINKFKAAVGKPIWMWTGYLYEDLIQNEKAKKILDSIDVLVDGPFVESKKNLLLKYRGSYNQRVLNPKTGEVIIDD